MAELTGLDEVASRADEDEMNGNGSGRSIEDMAAEAPEEGDGQTLLDFGDHLNLTIKGKKPTESKIKFRPIQRDITGQIGDKSDDETYTFMVVARLQDIQTPLKRDETGRVIARKRVHVLDPVDIVRVDEADAEAILTKMDED